MKKRVQDLNSEESVIVFKHLKSSDRRKILSEFFKCKVYEDARTYRDVLTIIVKHLDFQTWGRVKQTCHLFNKTLQVHPTLEKIQRFFETPDNLDKFEDLILPLCVQAFIPCLKRIALMCSTKSSDPDFYLKSFESELIRFQSRQRNNFKTQAIWFELVYFGKIRYPSGFILFRNIFDSEILEGFYHHYSALSDEHKQRYRKFRKLYFTLKENFQFV